MLLEAIKVFAKVVNDELKEINKPPEARESEFTDEEVREKIIYKQRKLEKELHNMFNERIQGRG